MKFMDTLDTVCRGIYDEKRRAVQNTDPYGHSEWSGDKSLLPFIEHWDDITNYLIHRASNYTRKSQQQQTKATAADSNAVGSGDMSSASIPAPTEAQKEIATTATQEFEKGNMEKCKNHMERLQRQRPMDPKVVHNHAVVCFYNSNQCAVEELKNGLNTACQLAKNSEDPLDGIEDVDNAVLYYNQAVLNFVLKQYRTALAILDRGFQYIEPPDEALAQNVLLLWTELHLCVGQPDKALRVLGYLEKGVANGKGGQGTGTPERGEQGASGATDSNEALRFKISLFKTRCLAMMKSLKSCKREIKALTSNSPGLTGTAVQYLRAYFEYLRGNCRKGQKILVSAPTAGVPCVGQSLTTMLHNNLACIHMQMRKPHTGAHLLRLAWQENEKAMKEIKSTSKGKPIQYIAISRHHELLYNMGIQALHCNRASQAFDFLIVAIQVYQINPRLWLRLAECCIMHHRENNDQDSKLEKRQQVFQGSVGSGFHRKLIIGPGTGQDKLSNNTAAVPALTLEFAAFCLSSALSLLPPDPLDIADVPPTDDADSSKAAEPGLVPAPPASPMRPAEVANLRCSILAASAYVSLCLNDCLLALKHANNLLRQPRLSGAQRYCGNMYMAEALVAMDRIADAISFLNPEALSPTDVSTVPPEAKVDPEKIDKNDKGDRDATDFIEDKSALVAWVPRDVTKARAFMQHNLAVAHATRTEYDKAMKYLTEGSRNAGSPLPAQMYYLKLYLDLMEGRRNAAQVVIKDHFGHVTPNQAV
ncbi:CCR4-NOT transcription complex subunit 10-like isoform X2 [Babylonia areolata]|uniref:CCR4-NOT transcription complex subunit 10-like isoform X2 n=1 Tax=Babylonia areolata TaxID=304850 RepID=UPI003FCF3E5C